MARFGSKVLGAVAALVATSAVPAHATKSWLNYCGNTGSVTTCASVTVTTTAEGSGTRVVITVQNLRGWYVGDTAPVGTFISAIAITAPSNLGASSWAGGGVTAQGGASAVGTNKKGGPGAQWSLEDSPTNSLGLGSVELRSNITGSAGGIYGCGGGGSVYFMTCNGGYIQFSFFTANAWSENDAEIAWKVQGLPESLECRTDETGTGSTRDCNVVPEPITMVLLGSGLAGLGGAGFLNRRKKNGEIETV